MHHPIIFIRHGQTDWNAAGRLQGQRDIPLNDNGRAQAKRNGRALAEAFSDFGSFDFVASPLMRARETMEIVRTALDLDPQAYRLDDRLKEIHYGTWEGFTNDELAVREPQVVAERHADVWRFMPSGGESYAVLADRAAACIAAFDRPAVVVAHGGVGRVLRHRLLGVDPHLAVGEFFPQDRVFHWREGAETVI